MLVFLLHVSLQLGLTWTYFRVQTHTVCCPLSLLVQCFSITGSIFPERPIHDRRNVAVNMLLRCSDGLIINMTTIMRLTLTFKGTNTHTHTPPHTHTHTHTLSITGRSRSAKPRKRRCERQTEEMFYLKTTVH